MRSPVLVYTDDEAALRAFLARWRGTVLQTTDFAALGLAMPRQHVVRVDPSAADVRNLARNLRARAPDTGGSLRLSSDRALRLVALAAQESTRDLTVNLDFLARASDYADRMLSEAPAADDSGGAPGARDWQPNPTRWPYMRSGGAQDINVVDAWSALQVARRLDPGSPRVRMAILDAGFVPDQDFPEGWRILPVGAAGRPNPWGCSTGAGCVWHGTDVVHAAAGRVNNGFGAAGPAGPVAELTLAQSPGGSLGEIIDYAFHALGPTLLGAPRVVNMSLEVSLPAVAFPLAQAIDLFTGSLRRANILVFASAGNHGDDVDALDGVGDLRWERAIYIPCENAGVVCVGGLAWDANTRHPESNYGTGGIGEGTVDLFAPYSLWVGASPARPGNVARAAHGTSVSSPFAAGVVALVLAADPRLSADGVYALLHATAHTGSPDRTVPRWLNAYAAVRAALRDPSGNHAPWIAIERPVADATVQVNTDAHPSARVYDIEDGPACCDVRWTDLDEPAVAWRAPTPSDARFTRLGRHRLRATATDRGGRSTHAEVVVTVVNAPPTVHIVAPGSAVTRGARSLFTAYATDPNEPDGRVACERIAWRVTAPDTVSAASGCEVTVTFQAMGPRTVQATATDAHGSAASSEATVNVTPPPVNPPPVITRFVASDERMRPYAPDDEVVEDPFNPRVLNLSGAATDDGPLTYQWTARFGEHNAVVVGTAPTLTWRPIESFGAEKWYSRDQPLELTLRVSDGSSTSVRSIPLRWRYRPG